MAAITLSRQLGSLGYQVGEAVARRLGFRVVRQELINEAARRAGVPEVALAAIDELGLLQLCPSPRDCQGYNRAVWELMNEIADQGGAVIIGRAGQAVLHGRSDVLHVRIIAPLPARIERVAERHGISPAAAQAQIEASDRYRRNYVRRFYHVRWDDPSLYHLTVNTEHIHPEAAASIIAGALAYLVDQTEI